MRGREHGDRCLGNTPLPAELERARIPFRRAERYHCLRAQLDGPSEVGGGEGGDHARNTSLVVSCIPRGSTTPRTFGFSVSRSSASISANTLPSTRSSLSRS